VEFAEGDAHAPDAAEYAADGGGDEAQHAGAGDRGGQSGGGADAGMAGAGAGSEAVERVWADGDGGGMQPLSDRGWSAA